VKASPVVLNIEFLKQRELLPKGFRGVVKILGDGEMRIPVRVEGLRLSGSAKKKIEKAGGQVVAK
jgi:ribosomal protein L15